MEKLLLPFKMTIKLFGSIYIPEDLKVMGILCFNINLITRTNNSFWIRKNKNSII
jgi:hypothetical protein